MNHHRNTQLGLIFLFILLGLVSQSLILSLFPHTGLGGLICYPSAFLIACGLGFLYYKLSSKISNSRYEVLLFVFLLIVQISLQLAILPQDYGGNAFLKLRNMLF